MSLKYDVDNVKRIITITGFDNVTITDRQNLISFILNDRSIDGCFSVLINISDVNNKPESTKAHSIAYLIELLQRNLKDQLLL